MGALLVPIDPPTQVFGGNRFYEAPPWRYVVSDLGDNILTFLDRLCLDRSVTVTRGGARVISGRVPSDNPEVNIPTPDPDGEPFLSEGTRIVSCFRREGAGGTAAKVMKADASAAVAYATIDLGAEPDDVWVSVEVILDEASRDFFTSGGISVRFVRAEGDDFWLADPALTSGGYWTDFNGGEGGTLPPFDTRFLLEWNLNSLAGTTELFVDEVSVYTSVAFGFANLFRFGVETVNGGDGFGGAVYIDNVKIGTTRGGDDLFSDDFEDGTLDAWTSVTGDVSVIDDPFGESGGGAPWVIRARGLVLTLEDDADSDHATSTFTAYDPWKYLYRRPILTEGAEPGDVSYRAGTRADEIIIDQLTAAVGIGGSIFTDFGQTAFYTGTIESTEPLPDGGDGLAMTFRAGQTLGEMLDLLVATGTCDVVFDPIYDPENRPGILCQMSIYQSAGAYRPNAVMGWDRWPRSLVQLSRQVDGTERADIVQMYAGQGGPPVPLEFDSASVGRFGQYWALQYLPGVPSLAGAHTIAQRQLALLKDGQYTYALSPASERSPLLFEEYREADYVPVFASERFRDPISGVPVRVESIPIVIGDDSLERVNQMLVSFAPESGS